MADYPRRSLTPEERAELIRRLENHDLGAMRDHLADALGVQPDWDALAKKSPDRWVQALLMLSKLGGVYVDKLEVQGTGIVAFAREIERMSDAELEARYQAKQSPKPAKVIELPSQTAQDDAQTSSSPKAHP
jgi:hypothetical protein